MGGVPIPRSRQQILWWGPPDPSGVGWDAEDKELGAWHVGAHEATEGPRISGWGYGPAEAVLASADTRPHEELGLSLPCPMGRWVCSPIYLAGASWPRPAHVFCSVTPGPGRPGSPAPSGGHGHQLAVRGRVGVQQVLGGGE